ncbi:hypothetical protein SETIT_7G119900v2 [Setaria italica]|nr:hypothetical protein SETIT_7G119900v2 [Setaria italica]
MDDILFENGIVRLCDGIVEVGFYDRGCSLDYLKLHGILSLLKTVDGYYAQYFQHLLNYLKCCPAGLKLRSELAIRFLINHPSLEFYQDRVKQAMLLDNLLFRIFNNPNTSYGAMNAITAAMGSFYNWWIFLEHCPEMNKILLFDAS